MVEYKRWEIFEKFVFEKVISVVLMKLELIVWFFNIRGVDVLYILLFFCFVFLYVMGWVDLFIEFEKFNNDVIEYLGLDVNIVF